MAGEVTVSVVEQPTLVSVNETSVSIILNEQIVTLDLGVTGPQGPRGNSLLNGVGEPILALGISGDFYIDTVANELYGPKTSGSWGIGIKLTQELGFVFEQVASATVWTINHNLDFVPNITVVDTFGTVVEGSYTYPNNTTVVLTFSSQFSGKAFLS